MKHTKTLRVNKETYDKLYSLTQEYQYYINHVEEDNGIDVVTFNGYDIVSLVGEILGLPPRE